MENCCAVAFHVNYWDSLGWKDRRSSPEFTERQRSYAQLWRSENIYTPCFVLNGEEWHNWLNLRGVPSVSGIDAGVLEINSTNTGLWNVCFTPANVTGASYEIHAVLVAGGWISEVKAGENRGRTLPHEFAALDSIQIGLTTANGVARGKFILDPARFPKEKALGLTVWVTRVGELKPLQVTGGWLIPPVTTTIK